MKVAIYTLGCKVNQYETQAMEQELLAQGARRSCPLPRRRTPMLSTAAPSRQSATRSPGRCSTGVRRKHPGAVAAVCGCYPQTHAEDVRKPGGGPDLPAPATARALSAAAGGGGGGKAARSRPSTSLLSGGCFEVLPAGGLEGRTRAMLKVEDGCVNFCTYCIIPYARGPVRSLPVWRQPWSRLGPWRQRATGRSC